MTCNSNLYIPSSSPQYDVKDAIFVMLQHPCICQFVVAIIYVHVDMPASECVEASLPIMRQVGLSLIVSTIVSPGGGAVVSSVGAIKYFRWVHIDARTCVNMIGCALRGINVTVVSKT